MTSAGSRDFTCSGRHRHAYLYIGSLLPLKPMYDTFSHDILGSVEACAGGPEVQRPLEFKLLAFTEFFRFISTATDICVCSVKRSSEHQSAQLCGSAVQAMPREGF